MHIKNISLIPRLALYLTGLLFAVFTRPNSLPVIMIGCLLAILIMITLISSFLRLFDRAIPISHDLRHRLSIGLSLFVSFIIVMQSVGQLSFKDITSVIALELIAYVYISRVGSGFHNRI
jgi:predicted tellurium resistance membrane protein TerC